jgi:peroxiredoxin
MAVNPLASFAATVCYYREPLVRNEHKEIPMAFTLCLNAPAPDFCLPGVDGKDYALASFKDAKALIVVFTCNHCPAAIGSQDRMIALCREYQPKGVAMVAINSNEDQNHPTDSFEHMKVRAAEKAFPFPYLRDESQAVGLAYGALRTPHFYVFDQQRRLRYTGRMDDNPYDAAKAGQHPP